ncbi:MAG TPA: sugar phosphate isomerase/epimerase [Terrimicrobiaceae bacterium]
MKLGVFAKTYERPSVDQVFEAADRDGFSCVQFNLACIGLETLPREPVPETVSLEIERAAQRHGIEIAAISGTFNMAHPVTAVRHDGVGRLKNVIAWAAATKVPVITLCTGSRDPVDMWRAHPENRSPQAWQDLLETLTQVLSEAEGAGVTLAVEPEPANVVADAMSARRLLDTLCSSRLKIILDPANLANVDAPNGDRKGLAKAIDLLAVDTIMVHAKDRRADGSVCPAGQGVVEFAPFLGHLRHAGYDGPLVVHGIDEAEVPIAVTYLRSTLETLFRKPPNAIY